MNHASIKPPRGSLSRLNRTQLSSLTKFRSALQSEPTEQNGNKPEQRPTSSQENLSRASTRKVERTRYKGSSAMSETSSTSARSRDSSLTRKRTGRDRGTRNTTTTTTNNNNDDKENESANNTRTVRRRDTARSKSRTRNNSYKKPMTLNEAKEKCKALRQQLNEVNEAHDRLQTEKEDLEDELNTIQQRHSFEIEQKESTVHQLQRDKCKIENEHSLNLQKLQSLQTQIEYKDSQIQMAQSAKNAADQQMMTLQQAIKMKDGILSNKEQELHMVKSQQQMLSDQCRAQQQQIAELTQTVNQLRSENSLKQHETEKLKQENYSLSIKSEQLSKQNTSQYAQIQQLTQEREKLQNEVSFNTQRMQTIQRDFHSLQQQKEMLERECQSQSQQIHQHRQEIQQLGEKCGWFDQKSRKDEEVRKRLHNTIQELKGNIRVFCRVRPMLNSHDDKKDGFYEFTNDDIESQSITLLTPPSVSGISGQSCDGKRYAFEFDRVFRPFAQQDIIFDEISQLVQSALDGYKVCIFAYGQTGSGKTFTMEGPSVHRNDVNRGMIPRSVQKIFEHKETLKAKGWHYECKATYLEIYNERIRDLLGRNHGGAHNNNNNSDDNIQYLEVHQRTIQTQKGQKVEVYVEGLTEVVVNSAMDVYPLLSSASSNRSVGKTDCNERSSRSHSVFQLFLHGENSITGQKRLGVLNLIDLAGSERLKKSNATGIQLKETQNINKSLACLGDVIAALSSKKNRSHIPYRNSKLTYLLMNCFGGDAKTLMFVNLCPEKDKLDESLCSLRFAAKVNDCQIGIAKRNVS